MGEARSRGSFEERKSLSISRRKGIPENVCIICRKQKDNHNFNDEHVIPESLNGYYHIRLVCTSCNSKMGKDVDSLLIGHVFSDFFRYKHKMKGKKGHIPIPLKGKISHPSNPQIKYKFVLNDCDEMILKQETYVNKIEDDSGNLKQVSVSVDTSSQSSIDNIIEKICIRTGTTPEKMRKETKREIIDPSIPFHGTIKVDVRGFKLGLLKIAYEFSIDNILGYFSDDIAIKISQILYSADLSRVSEIKMTSGFEDELWQELEPYFDYESRYFIVLVSINGNLVCCIKLCDLFSISIQMSDEEYLTTEDGIIGINDLTTKQFRITRLNEHFLSSKEPTYTRFLYHLPGVSEIAEIKSKKFTYEGEKEGNPIIYNSSGEIIYHDFLVFLDTLMPSDRIENQMFINFFSFENAPPVFVKSLISGNLLKVIGFEIERKIEKIK